MRRAVVLPAICVALACCYQFVVVFAFGYFAALPLPAWWVTPARHHHWLFYSQSLLLDTLVLAAISLPFAYILNRLFRRDAPLAAVAISLSLALIDAVDVFGSPNLQLIPVDFRVYLFAGAVRLLCVLPLLVLIFSRRPLTIVGGVGAAR